MFFFFGIKNDDWNRRHIKSNQYGLAYSLFDDCIINGKFESKIMFNDGSTANCSDYDMVISYSYVRENESKYDGYDLVGVSVLYNNYSTNKININDIDAIYIDLTQPNESEANRISFSIGGVHHDKVYNRGHLDLSGVNDLKILKIAEILYYIYKINTFFSL